MNNEFNIEQFALDIQMHFQSNEEPVAFLAAIKPMRVASVNLDTGVAQIQLPTEIAKAAWENNNAKYMRDFMRYSFEVTGVPLTAELSVVTEIVNEDLVTTSTTGEFKTSLNTENSHLNPDYTFEKWVPGSSNDMATAASQGVADAPGREYNPLLIYGDSGLGKTHLMQAIGNRIQSTNPEKVVKYATSEEFYVEFLNGIRSGADISYMDTFQKKYREVDVLLIDDVQMFEGQVRAQEEFFNTFNAITRDGGQIVMTSDRLPDEIKIEDRLITRFKQGISVLIEKPDEITKIAILMNRAEEQHLTINRDVIEMIARQVNGSVRELEGVFNQVALLAKMGKDVTYTEVEKILGRLSITTAHTISIADIQRAVTDWYGVSLSELVGTKRSKSIVLPRQVAMYLSRVLTDESLPKIGQAFGGKDHTTVMHSTDKITLQIEEDPTLKKTIDQLTEQIKN
ncbi:MAG: chromosomal replication initiator protein DnaA [Lactobacillaceae bacterium]|jgi:chromosomal replication initiator protein|nr:chromosomal replication initiator protein DnaA [Lactobacillaceae bacterium]